MKSRNLFSLGLAAVLLLSTASCSDDDTEDTPLSARLDVTEVGTGSIGGDVSIEQGTPLAFAFDARKGATDLETFSVSVTGVNVVNPIPTSYGGKTYPYELSNDDDEIYIDTLAFINGGLNLGTTSYTFTVTDGNGASKSTSFDVTVVSGTTSLSSPQPFTWQRVGGANGIGLSQFGLKWTQNSTTNAIVAIDNATTMVDLGTASWANITTQQALNSAINSGTSISQYTGVSATVNGNYNDVLGVIYNGVNYILRVEEGIVTTGGAGTTITINGQYKE